MHETVRLGRIGGIRIGANWSVLIIAWLIAFGLAVSALPELSPGYPTGLYWTAAIGAALAFFAALLAHEMAHALTARAAGLPVEGITLWALGGVSKLGGDAPDARTELRIAVVGPLTSLGLGGVFFATTVLGAALGLPDLLVTTLGWLATINVVLGLFNLMPAFPLDGGRVLRAALWRWHGDRLRATRAASMAGRVFGYALVGIGVVAFMSGYVVDGLWSVMLGWFVLSIARAELAQVEQHELLRGVTVGDVMTRDPFSVPPDIDVQQLLDRYVLTHRYSSYPVVDPDGRFLGLATLDSIRRVPADRRVHTHVLAAAYPADEVVQVPPEALLEAVLPRLASTRVGRMVVVHDGRLVGLVSHTDVVSCLERRSLARAAGTPV
jgi:Zn-dependent protease